MREKIEELERRIRELEARHPQVIIMPAPIYYPPQPVIPFSPGWQPYYPVICGDSTKP